MFSDIFGSSITGVMGSIFHASSQANAAQNAAFQARANATHAQAMMQTASFGTINHSRNIGLHQSAVAPMVFRPTVAQTAASRVDKPEWEKNEDRKDAELDAWIAGLSLSDSSPH